VVFASFVLVMRVGGEIQTAMVPRVVVAENKLLVAAHVLVSISQPLDSGFNVYEFAHVKDRTVDEEQLPTNVARMTTAFVVRDYMCGDHFGLVDRVSNLLEVCLNLQT